MELTTQQQRAKNLILDFLSIEENNFFLLKGYAGTGKTTTINQIIAEYQKNNYKWIASVAPTHKAVQVLRKKGAEANCHNIDYTTLHQLLGLTSEIDYATGSQIFTQVDKNNIKKYDMIIIDECSMIDDQIWQITKAEIMNYNKKAILLGDPAQLPPINEPVSPIFKENIIGFEITDVVRSNQENPLTFVTTNARNNIICDQTLTNKELTNGVWLIENKRLWLDALIKSFKSDKHKTNTDYTKAIAWTNKSVNWINNFVRDELLDFPTKPYTVGERLVASEHICDYRDTSEILAHNSSEFTVVNVKEHLDDTIPHYWLKVEDDDGCKFPIRIVADKNIYLKELNTLANNSKSCTKDEMRKILWENYWNFKRSWANVNYNYALTSHKSQGSTYNNAFVAQTNILSNPKRKEAFQSLYVAYSRASERLFINQ